MASIIVSQGRQEGDFWPLGRRTTVIGRGETLPVQILDDLVSRRHLQIRYDPQANTYTAVDMHSRNGVYVNDHRITDETVLADGDTIAIGQTMLLFTEEDIQDRESAMLCYKKVGEKMKVTIIYDNEVCKEGLISDWGFSCMVEVENTPRILFDTGSNGSFLLSNMKKLGIDPSSIDSVFITHNHFDHVGGLSAFLELNSDVKVYVPASLRGVRSPKEVISVDEPMEIYHNVFTTGELENIEQSLVIKTDKGIILIVGCSHPMMADILERASTFGSVYAILGGLHGFSEFELFENL